MMPVPPNNALQRTRVRPAGGRSPLSFETFGDQPKKSYRWVIATAWIFATACFQPRRTPEFVEIPKGFVGWVRINFDDPDAAPLPIRDGARVMRIAPSGVLVTSSHFEEGWAKDRYFYYSSEGLTELRQTGWGEGGMIWSGHSGTGTGEQGRYHACFFVGTEAELNSAGALFNESVKGKWPIPSEPTPGSSMPLAE